ncbi:hypothetical protein PR048_006434 [Dryococelus australis]|uniref:Uncharacterized protein n=1 Tax=Dryococelus australis TaxID=614101 RepID=A0ABQ9IB31_9NEOP|nr:hypothetical protein PR048_006434 [Dryococelus australis]
MSVAALQHSTYFENTASVTICRSDRTCVGSELEKILRKHRITSKPQLKEFLQKEWNTIVLILHGTLCIPCHKGIKQSLGRRGCERERERESERRCTLDAQLSELGQQRGRFVTSRVSEIVLFGELGHDFSTKETSDLLASHKVEPGSMLGRVTGFSQGMNHAERCLWLEGFLGDLPFPPHFHSGAAPYSPKSLIGSQDLDVILMLPWHWKSSALALSPMDLHSAGRGHSAFKNTDMEQWLIPRNEAYTPAKWRYWPSNMSEHRLLVGEK